MISGTPGRVLDHLKRGTIQASRLRFLVLDEADEMLSMGFAKELNAIIEKLPKERQTLLFSATVDRAIKRVIEKHHKNFPDVLLKALIKSRLKGKEKLYGDSPDDGEPEEECESQRTEQRFHG